MKLFEIKKLLSPVLIMYTEFLQENESILCEHLKLNCTQWLNKSIPTKYNLFHAQNKNKVVPLIQLIHL